MLRSDINEAPAAIKRFHNDVALPLFNLLDTECFIAGGCLRDSVAEFTDRKDVDVWFPTEIHWRHAIQMCPGSLLYTSANAVAFKSDLGVVDLVRHFADDPATLLGKFDFVACCAAITRTEYIRHPDFERDAFARKLTINSLANATADRMNRFLTRGWRISTGDQIKIAMQPPKAKSYPCAS